MAARLRVTDLPQGWCDRGHLIKWRPTASKKKTPFKCSCCHQEKALNIFTCHCSDYFACDQCLIDRKTCPPPPTCPSLSCVGSCTLRHKPLITKCHQCQQNIERSSLMWMCSERSCRSIICRSCASRRADPQPASSSVSSHNPQHSDSNQTSKETATSALETMHAIQAYDLVADVQSFLDSFTPPPPRPCSPQTQLQAAGQPAPMRDSNGQ